MRVLILILIFTVNAIAKAETPVEQFFGCRADSECGEARKCAGYVPELKLEPDPLAMFQTEFPEIMGHCCTKDDSKCE